MKILLAVFLSAVACLAQGTTDNRTDAVTYPYSVVTRFAGVCQESQKVYYQPSRTSFVCGTDNKWYQSTILESKVAALPLASIGMNIIVKVTDGSSSLDCTTGSGTNTVWCSNANGSTWTSVGGNVTASPYPTITDASPIAWNLGGAAITNGIVTVDHTVATRALNLTNLINGGSYTLVIKQDSTGGAAMTLGTGCTWKVSGGGSGAITLTSAASAIDVLSFTYDGTNCYANFQTNFN